MVKYIITCWGVLISESIIDLITGSKICFTGPFKEGTAFALK